jgi:uncharacterized protein (DUF1697 family)
MTRYVALLRGINTGGHRVKMDRLRDLFGEMGFGDVQSYIASGNVIFSTDEGDPQTLERQIETHLESKLGWPALTFLRTLPQLQDIARFESPDHAAESDSTYVAFLRHHVSEEVMGALSEFESDTNCFRQRGREVYWLIHGKVSDSPLFKTGITKPLGTAEYTMRNMNTVRKLVSRFGGD